MEYRILPHGGEKISVIGMGTSVIGGLPEAEAVKVFEAAMAAGINHFDLAGGHAALFPALGKALRGKREQVYLQVHFGADYTSGEYGWTTELEKVKAAVAWQLEQLGTDYIDFGFIHCLDEFKDLEDYKNNGVLDYLLALKAAGTVRHIGLSTHNPELVNALLDLGVLDMVMFSINPLYDLGQGKYALGSGDIRHQMYLRCQREGVGISVMKPYGAGQLLDEKKSPFGAAMTPAQCIQYCLDKPGVINVVPGIGNMAELEATLAWLTAGEEGRDYSIVGSFTPQDQARCVYCRHCHPCPVGLDVALINKYYDLDLLGDPLAKEHYSTLDKTAGDCIACGHCDGRCPFHVPQSARMHKIAEHFGK